MSILLLYFIDLQKMFILFLKQKTPKTPYKFYTFAKNLKLQKNAFSFKFIRQFGKDLIDEVNTNCTRQLLRNIGANGAENLLS